MQEPMQRPDIPGDPLDADLVCEQCGTVNQPGTLYCHACGNNLREQKQRRMAKGEVVLGEGTSHSRILLGALSTLGLLLILYVAWNVNTIAEQLVGGAPRIDTSLYWQGPLAPQFEDLAQQLRSAPLTPQEIAAAHESPVLVGELSGHYTVRRDQGIIERPLGQLMVREDGDLLLFVALLDSGAEVRGTARLEEGGRLSSSSVTYSRDGRTIGGVGFATPHPAGGYAATGVSDLDDLPFALRIYRAR